MEALRQDPRPAYRDDPDERFGFYYAGNDVRFSVSGQILTVVEIVPMTEDNGDPYGKR